MYRFTVFCTGPLLDGATDVDRVLLDCNTLGFPIFFRGIDYITFRLLGSKALPLTEFHRQSTDFIVSERRYALVV